MQLFHLIIIASRKQEPFSRSLFSLYLTGDLSQITSGSKKLASDIKFRPFEVSGFVQKDKLSLNFWLVGCTVSTKEPDITLVFSCDSVASRGRIL